MHTHSIYTYRKWEQKLSFFSFHDGVMASMATSWDEGMTSDERLHALRLDDYFTVEHADAVCCCNTINTHSMDKSKSLSPT
jgi:hypothetical protein